MSGSRTLAGGCHCGNIRYALDWPEAEGPTAFRHCTCDFCTRIGARYTAHPEARLDIRIADEAHLLRYRFATKTADFLICQTCGVMPVVIGGADDSSIAVVNVNTLEDFDIDPAAVRNVSFDGEQGEERALRRSNSWIGRVTLSHEN